MRPVTVDYGNRVLVGDLENVNFVCNLAKKLLSKNEYDKLIDFLCSAMMGKHHKILFYGTGRNGKTTLQQEIMKTYDGIVRYRDIATSNQLPNCPKGHCFQNIIHFKKVFK